MKTLKQLLQETFSGGLYTSEFIQKSVPKTVKEWLTQKLKTATFEQGFFVYELLGDLEK